MMRMMVFVCPCVLTYVQTYSSFISIDIIYEIIYFAQQAKQTLRRFLYEIVFIQSVVLGFVCRS